MKTERINMKKYSNAYYTMLNALVVFAKSISKLSKCNHGKVAALIFTSDMQQILSMGINGGGGNVACLCDTVDKYGCIHAEINALCKCKHDTHGAYMLITKAPCVQCAAAIVNAGITHVYYAETYSCTAGIDLLIRSGVEVTHTDSVTHVFTETTYEGAITESYKSINNGGQ